MKKEERPEGTNWQVVSRSVVVPAGTEEKRPPVLEIPNTLHYTDEIISWAVRKTEPAHVDPLRIELGKSKITSPRYAECEIRGIQSRIPWMISMNSADPVVC